MPVTLRNRNPGSSLSTQDGVTNTDRAEVHGIDLGVRRWVQAQVGRNAAPNQAGSSYLPPARLATWEQVALGRREQGKMASEGWAVAWL